MLKLLNTVLLSFYCPYFRIYKITNTKKTCWKDLKINKTIIVQVQGPVVICCRCEGGGGEGLDDVTMKFTLFPEKADCDIVMLLLISNYCAVNFLQFPIVLCCSWQ